jgi:hypothetical protein
MAIGLGVFEGFVVGKKPMRTANDGKKLLSFGLSVLTDPKATDPTKKSVILECMAFGQTADYIDTAINNGANYLFMCSNLKTSRYTADNGQERTKEVWWLTSASCHTKETHKPTKRKPYLTPFKDGVDAFEDFL